MSESQLASLPFVVEVNDYTISTDKSRLDFDVIHGFLRNAYWSPGVSLDVVKRAASHSLIQSHPSLQGLRRWVLFTRDAHGLYEQFGFERIPGVEQHLMAWRDPTHPHGTDE